MSFKKIYWIKNFETNENFTFPEDKITFEKLKEYNEKWFNIYQTVNSFTGDKRQDKYLAEIRACFIDIDYPEIISPDFNIENRAKYLLLKFNKEVKPNLDKIKSLYDIRPHQINVTYKGFHILFNYSEDCYLINTELHKEINNILWDLLWGDSNARDLSRVYKVHWFYDCKEKRKGKIKNIENYTENLISKEIITKKFNLCFSTRDIETQKLKKEQNIENVYKNIELINNQDCFLIIEKAINTLNSKFVKSLCSSSEIEICLNKLKFKEEEHQFSLLEEDGLTKTSWLKIELNELWIWQINDYTKKTRRGNYNFIKNWILSPTMKENEKLLFFIQKEIFWFTLNKKNEDILNGDYKLLWDVSLSMSKLNLNEKGFTEEYLWMEKENREVFTELTKDFLQKIHRKGKAPFIALVWALKNTQKQIDEQGKYYYKINWDDFLKELWIKNSYTNKKEYKVILKYISKLEIPFIKEIKWQTYVFWQEIFTIGFTNNFKATKWNKDSFIVYPTLHDDFIFSENSRLAFVNKEIIKLNTKSLEWKDFLIEIDWRFKNWSSSFLKFDLENTFSLLNLNQGTNENLKQLRNHLEKSKNLNFIKDYRISRKENKLELFNFKLKNDKQSNE